MSEAESGADLMVYIPSGVYHETNGPDHKLLSLLNNWEDDDILSPTNKVVRVL